ncbi:MAG TPA: 3-isopropylmalate dehydratase small subunit [Acetobacteraceae bacterium]|nr:3-isopropylmalate dehydratase small subunit [Acetobacteraceae bacterium]
MEKFEVVSGVAAPMLMNNINTDLIAPSHFPGKQPEEAVLMTLKDKMFANLRFHPDGAPKPDFVLNQPRYRDARFILAGPNFGCGSSRETAVWALREAGIRCVIAPSFGDIFHDNAHQNGLLPLKLEVPAIERLAKALEASNASELTVDLVKCELRVAGHDPVPFTLDDDRRQPLLEGMDQLAFMLRSEPEVTAFEASDAEARPWAYPG